MADTHNETVFACKCLNIRIRPQPPPAGNVAPTSHSTPEYEAVYVGDEGITLSHPQVTLRTQSRGVPLADKSRCTRSVTLSCLLCQTIAYRVYQTIPIEAEGKDGSMLPTDDWAEQEILKSASGWIELHNDCLTNQDIIDAENSPSYSTIFSIVLPSPSTPSSEGDSYPIYIATSPPPPPSQTPIHHLPTLTPIFAPAPFTPSHPVFVHLSSLAATKSRALRTDAETYIAEVVKEKVAEIEQAEAELRSQVEMTWQGFKSGVGKIEQERLQGTSRKSNKRSSGNWKDEAEAGSSKAAAALVTVHDFNPVASPRKVASPTPARRTSSLSASLATSRFHHPRALAEETCDDTADRISISPPNNSSNPSSPLSSKSYTSLSSHSSKSLAIRNLDAAYEDGTYITPFKRNMDQGNDTATSFRFFTILEADTARTRQKASEAAGDANGERAQGGATAEGETSRNGVKPESSNGPQTRARKTTDDDNASDAHKQENGLREKRKVTFDVKPDVVTIKRELEAEAKEEETELAGRAADEMIFDLEDENGERPIAEATLQLHEPPVAPVRPIRVRAHAPGLPSSLSTLRPASLPVPSAIRPSRTLEPADDPAHARISQSLQKPTRDFVKRVTPPQATDSDEDSSEVDPQEAEIMKLVAANTPSHRGAWKKNSKAWQMFVRRNKGGMAGHGQAYIPEENEDDDTLAEDDESEGDSGSDMQKRWDHYISTSLPFEINVPHRPQAKEILSLASYQPKSEHAAKPTEAPTPEALRDMSSTAWRKAAYAERDLSRAMDPGALDFAPEEDDDFDGDAAVVGSLGQGERGRLRALRIIQGGLNTPASGMWRSLA